MAEAFLSLSPEDRRDALAVASAASGRPLHLLEKDVWVVWALEALFGSAIGANLVFKGGTSLSKAYSVIRRFSEDVDLTLDMRALAPDLIAGGVDGLPSTRSQERRWSKELKVRLANWVQTDALPLIADALSKVMAPATATADGDKIYIDYDPLAVGTGYVSPRVMLEFGARSTGEPWEQHDIVCDAAEHLPQLTYPSARPRVMKIERTFWEKATAIHVFCIQGRFRGTDRFARHWHDLARLDQSSHADSAIADVEIAQDVARHKAMFFAEKDNNGEVIDYEAAISGSLRLVPEGPALDLLADDYHHMVEDGLLFDDAELFVDLIARCRLIEQKANQTRR